MTPDCCAGDNGAKRFRESRAVPVRVRVIEIARPPEGRKIRVAAKTFNFRIRVFGPWDGPIKHTLR